jgi:hypothetical protein
MIPRAIPAVTRDVKWDDPDYNRDPGLPVWGLGVGLTTPPRKNITVTEPQKNSLSRFVQGCSINRRRIRRMYKRGIKWRLQLFSVRGCRKSGRKLVFTIMINFFNLKLLGA